MLLILTSVRLHNILIKKWIKHGQCKWTVRWTENWLNCEAQKVVINSTTSSWRSTYSGDW